MIFTRTPSGLSNLHLFHGVDSVVFVEGGEHAYSYTDVCQGQAGTVSPDILYWQMVFQCMVPDKRVCFKPVGSKGTLKCIARDVASGLVLNVCVAMDQDFDRFGGGQTLADGVLYTWGYSWENDLFHEVVVKEAVFMLCPIDRTSNEGGIEADISSATLRFLKDIRWLVKADVVLSLSGCGLFDRKNWKRHIKSSSGSYGKPYVDVSNLRTGVQSVRASRGGVRFVGPGTQIHTIRDCFGHLLCTFLFRLLLHLLSKYSGSPSLSLVNATSLLIKITGDQLNAGMLHELHRHHEMQFAFMLP